MIKFLVLIFSLFTIIHAGAQENLLAGTDADTNSSNETAVDRCDDEYADMKMCISSIVEKHNFTDFASNIMNRDLILGILDEIQNASCFGTTNCANVKLGKFVFNAYDFIGEAVYRRGFECLVKEWDTIQAKSSQCVNILVMSGEIKNMKQESFFSAARLLIECTVSKFSCSEDERFYLLVGASHVISLIDDFMHPERILWALGFPEDALSKEEMIEVLIYFASIF
ncbi:hypothetical protein CAEBREN_02984 [Caenorhabditis brenneri]|uniref:DUF19 domain-containing protein n=1 Tax=Caenorhabditis brenneri TaxID=135651 RepID=G0MQH5_CAEBE|nr:hypothetical protein CAEBREN_02984 [Caenorhabditis brenneri]